MRKADSRACWWSAGANCPTVQHCLRILRTQSRYYLPSCSDITLFRISLATTTFTGGSKLEKIQRRNLWSPFRILVMKPVFKGHLVFFTIHCMLSHSQAVLTTMIKKDYILTPLILIKLLVFKFHMEVPRISQITGRTHKGVCNSLFDTVL